MSLARAILGVFLGLLARLWLLTLRLELRLHPSLLEAQSDPRPWVLAFFHGKQWPLLAWKRRRLTTVMVSLSKDGAIQTRALSVLGFDVVRGSSSRGGARGLAAVVRKLKAGQDAAFAVDGPRGPYGVPKPGTLLAAQKGGALLVPMGSAIAPRSRKVFGRAWDRFELAWPFARVAVTLGAPLEPGRGGTAELGAAIAAENAAAEAILAGCGETMVRFSGFLPRSTGRTARSHDL